MGNNYSGGWMRFTKLDATTVTFPAEIDIDANATVLGSDQGELYDRTLSLAGFAPVTRFVVKNVGGLLNLIGLAGQCVGAGLAITQVDHILRRTTDCQNAFSGTPHIQDRASAGLLILNSLNAPRKEDATLSATLYSISTGGNAPLARTNGVAAPTTVSEAQYELAISAFGASAFPELNGVNLECGVNVDIDAALASIWPTLAAVRTVRPFFTFDDRDLSMISNAILAAGYVTATHANTLVQLAKRADAAAFELPASTVHTSLSMAGMITPRTIASVGPNKRSKQILVLQGKYDGTNAPLLYNTAVAYDTTPP